MEEGSFDIIVSNCVLNLSTEKEKVLKSVFRLLKEVPLPPSISFSLPPLLLPPPIKNSLPPSLPPSPFPLPLSFSHMTREENFIFLMYIQIEECQKSLLMMLLCGGSAWEGLCIGMILLLFQRGLEGGEGEGEKGGEGDGVRNGLLIVYIYLFLSFFVCLFFQSWIC